MSQQINYSERLDRLRADAQRIDAVATVLVPGANMIYFTGLHLHLSERPALAFVLTDGGTAFIMPALELSKIDHLPPEMDVRHVFGWEDETGYEVAFAAANETLGLAGKRLGVDDMTMRVFESLALLEAIPELQMKPHGQALLNLRVIKADEEIALMREAIALSEKALLETLRTVRVGMTEREIAGLLAEQLQAAGSEGNAFAPLVQIGEKSALPHGFVGDRALAEGDILLLDFGGTCGGYPADITRTYVFGEPSDEVRAMYQAVYDANIAGRAACAPGVSAVDVDKATRSVIEAAGYGEYFIHRTGHGLGLEIHELPQIAVGSDDVLQTGMVFTIEPGIYVPGVGGVRIEDDVVVTADGAESLTTLERALTSVPLA
ncbi:MAG: Xaa-Pro peptidase family protein [Chloroflexota bacterium]